jgi:hypothetical protein
MCTKNMADIKSGFFFFVILLPYLLFTISNKDKIKQVVCGKFVEGHFTICQKPFECGLGYADKPLCNFLHDHWWQVI